ncbi:PREDICTED: 60S acidic ribosomal protein P1-like [Galeopterus variegatus]|uniref:60S acidic ribosomal protein P1-like n=1 Tax=Galeopterus variegatus TaxID=482537 RepID=A0ABM0RIM3_GALVR|nr:PREDICTED: 60S acidic ribosomal protein P1-like [Galeopterus variegatus]
MGSVSELACIYLALILHDDEATLKALASVNLGSLICNIGVGGPAPAAGVAPAGGPGLSITAASAEKKVGAKKEESEESDDDMGFDLFD